MRFRRNNGFPVSFFAFQDVITGVAGVMLIAVLLLMIGKRNAAPETATAGPGQALPQQDRLRELETELALVRQRVQDLRQEAGAFDAARKAKQELQLQTRHNRLLEKELDQRRGEHRTLRATLGNQQKALDALPADVQEYLDVCRQVREARQAWRNARQAMVPESQKTLVVLDCARSCWSWTRRGEVPVILGGEAAANPSAAWRDLHQRLQTLNPEEALLIVAVRPSAGGFIMALSAKIRTAFPRLPLALEPLPDETAGGIRLE